MTREGVKGRGREAGREEGKGEGTQREEGSRRWSLEGVGRGQTCRREPVCRAAAGSCSRLGAPGLGGGGETTRLVYVFF